jgi:anti-sigma-K factor RskA
MVHDDYKEMFPAHALSTLDAAEERALNEHLEVCVECRRDLAEWEAVAASLALSADPLEPSAEVRRRLLTQIQSEKSVSNVVPLARTQRNLWNSLGSLGQIAALLLFAALIIAVIVLWQQNRHLRRQTTLVEILSSPGAGIKDLHGTNEAPGASAKIVFDSTGRALLIVTGLPRPPQGKEYQLWFIEPKQAPRPGNTFSTDSAGRAQVDQHVLAQDRDYSVAAVTLEPAGGVKSPTGAMYLRSDY